MKRVTVKRVKCVPSEKRKTLCNKTYNLLIGCCILYGLLMNYIIVLSFSDFFSSINPYLFLICALSICFLGIYIVKSSDKPAMCFLGYTLIVIPIGADLSVILPRFAQEDILLAIGLTFCIVSVMTLLATMYPQFFSGLGKVLFLSHATCLLGELIALFAGFRASVYNWIFVIIYTLYVGYYWYRAQSSPKTLVAAIDSAAGLYLDIINLFLRLLKIIAKSKRRR